jgi:hypothetical protein
MIPIKHSVCHKTGKDWLKALHSEQSSIVISNKISPVSLLHSWYSIKHIAELQKVFPSMVNYNIWVSKVASYDCPFSMVDINIYFVQYDHTVSPSDNIKSHYFCIFPSKLIAIHNPMSISCYLIYANTQF